MATNHAAAIAPATAHVRLSKAENQRERNPRQEQGPFQQANDCSDQILKCGHLNLLNFVERQPGAYRIELPGCPEVEGGQPFDSFAAGTRFLSR